MIFIKKDLRNSSFSTSFSNHFIHRTINSCNIELRPKGIILRFRSLLETYGLVIPYYKLKIYKGKSEEYSFYKDQYFIKVAASSKAVHDFVKKIQQQKMLNTPPSIEDL